MQITVIVILQKNNLEQAKKGYELPIGFKISDYYSLLKFKAKKSRKYKVKTI